MEITPQEIQNLQGTRLSEKAPWETYGDEMGTKLSLELEDAIKRYEERKHEKSSQENEEELERQREINNQIAKEYQWVKPEEYEHVASRIGRILHSSQLILMLREMGLRCWYLPHGLPGRYTLAIQLAEGKEPEFGCWCMQGYMPEYSIMMFDDHGAPLAERLRGWRTVLLQLILKDAILEDDAVSMFGPAQGPASTRFNGLLYEFRNHLVKTK